MTCLASASVLLPLRMLTSIPSQPLPLITPFLCPSPVLYSSFCCCSACTCSVLLLPLPCFCLPFFCSGHQSPLLCSANDTHLFFTEIQFSPHCAQLWLEMHHQVTIQCTFLLMLFPFENVRCVLHLELQDGQLWDLEDLIVVVPTFKHLSYSVSVSSQSMIMS